MGSDNFVAPLIPVNPDRTWQTDLTLVDCYPEVAIVQICPHQDPSDPITWTGPVDGTPPHFVTDPPDGDQFAAPGGTGDLHLIGVPSDAGSFAPGPIQEHWTVRGKNGDLIGTGDGQELTMPLPPGDYDVEVTIIDQAGNKLTKRCHRRILAIPPKLTNCTVAVDSLWPPNHQLVNVGLGYTIERGTYPVASVIVTTYSNESDLGEDGDDKFSPDAKDLSAGTLRLRSERPGQSDGRVYLVVITATDTAGNRDVCCHITVTVPHDQSKASRELIAGMASSAAAYAESHDGSPPPGYVRVGDGPVIGPKQ